MPRHGGVWTPIYGLAASIALLAVGFGAGSYVTDMRQEWRTRIAKSEVEAGPKLAPATLPRYTVGESFEFSDGRRETVIHVQGKKVTWLNNRGNKITRYHNFLVPPLAWETRTRKSSAETNATPEMLWPLVVGKNQKFEFR